ncbi:chloramphenicol phosphotransferase CPT family protein [Vibrio europaeus]|uniref:chloramphenicol phosphotransferase CPT family protein n=1 Tax=Vibrio europaeus TaxID=300876 RepID=UPI00233EA65C|nr:AAA family ATPase [Vibrio europaeus]MDC5857462.1 chloramphenicol phosphotransferase CPT family protein [Vibrio europaeus]
MVIFLNGTSSSGKTTVSHALQQALADVYLHVSVDTYLSQIAQCDLSNAPLMEERLPYIVNGFHESAAAIARAGNNVIVDYVLQQPEWLDACVKAFEGLPVLFVGVHCPLEVLEAREVSRGDRKQGAARFQFNRVHSHRTYDLELDTSSLSVEACVSEIIAYIESGSKSSAFERLRAQSEIRKQT